MPRLFTWEAADGTIVPLTDDTGITVLSGAEGLETPSPILNIAERTSGDGGILAKRHVPPRAFVLPLLIATGGDIRLALRDAATLFEGPGKLRLDDGYGPRELRDVYYEAGLGGNEATGRFVEDHWHRTAASFIALDPYWYDAGASAELTVGLVEWASLSVIWASPDTRWTGGEETVVEVGDAKDALPIWTITGPFANLTIEVDGGNDLTIASALSAGEVLTVDARLGDTYGPSKDGGPIDWSLLSADTLLDTLPGGSVTIGVFGSGVDANSAVEVAWQGRHRTP